MGRIVCHLSANSIALTILPSPTQVNERRFLLFVSMAGFLLDGVLIGALVADSAGIVSVPEPLPRFHLVMVAGIVLVFSLFLLRSWNLARSKTDIVADQTTITLHRRGFLCRSMSAWKQSQIAEVGIGRADRMADRSVLLQFKDGNSRPIFSGTAIECEYLVKMLRLSRDDFVVMLAQ